MEMYFSVILTSMLQRRTTVYREGVRKRRETGYPSPEP
jgi:hypothetical protein